MGVSIVGPDTGWFIGIGGGGNLDGSRMEPSWLSAAEDDDDDDDDIGGGSGGGSIEATAE